MRLAREGDYWRALGNKKFKHTLNSLSFENLIGLPADGIPFKGPITVITGLNGAGKTTLLQAIFTALGCSPVEEWPISTIRIVGADLKLELVIEGTVSTRRISISQSEFIFDPPELSVNPAWIDAGTEALFQSNLFSKEKNLKELLEQFKPTETEGSDREELSDLVGKEYDRCLVYELEDFAGREVIPYFQVISGGVEYGSETMGVGELAIHHMVWAFSRVKANSFILLEEPETFISVQSQRKLMALLAQTCVKCDAWAVVTSHSPYVVKTVPADNVLVIARYGGTTKVIVPKEEEEWLTALGLPGRDETPIKRGVILVEDRLGVAFATTLISRYEPELLGEYRIVASEGASNVLKKLELFPEMKGWFSAVGLLDGDEKPKGHECDRPFTFLPGDTPPEELLMQVTRAQPPEMSALLGVPVERLELALSSIEGMNLHDWLEELAKRVDRSLEHVARSAFELWMQRPENFDSCDQSISEVLQLMTSA